jgi:2-aminoadipate transaminase
VVPRRWRRRALRLKQAADLQSNSLAQAVVDDYLGRHDFERRLPVLRRFYRRRAERLASAVRRAIPSWRFQFPAGGFGVWIETDAAVDERRFLAAAVEERVSFDPGTPFEAWPTGGATALRLCFSLARPAEFEEGARRLARAWRRAARRARGVEAGHPARDRERQRAG